jgi:alpha,alpha-trehalase
MALPAPFPTPKPVRTPTLYDYGVIGNLHTAALVSRFGSVDWCCLPRFASPSVFARLLDTRRGGFFEVAPTEAYESDQTYLPSSNVLLTRFFLRGGRQLDLVDFMPIDPGHPAAELPMLERMVELRGGPARIRLTVAPRFRYATEPATWHEQDGGFRAHGSKDRLWARASVELSIDREDLGAELALGSGERLSVEVGWGEGPPTAKSPEQLLRTTLGFWQAWVHPPTTPLHRIAGLWHPWVERSELALKLLSSESTGLFVAAPTTSLPEWPGGARNWDYRYAWVRDAAFSAQSLLLLGHVVEAERFLIRILEQVPLEDQSTPLRVMYGADGETDLAERELPHLEGFQGSRPVRVGNGAAEQFQLDIYGEVLDAAHLLAERRPAAVSTSYPRLAHLADSVVTLWSRPDQGIWEVRGPPRQYVHSKLMAWVALDRSVDLAQRFGHETDAGRWAPVRDAIRDWILTHGYDAASRSFVQAEGATVIDAANLRIPLVGFLPFEDRRVRGTVDRVRRELSVGPFVYRYRAPDGLAGPEGAFLPAAFWLVECLARMGQRPRAFSRWRRLLFAASPLGLYPEEYDPVRRLPLGNFPQAFTHIGVLRAAVALGATETPSFLEPPFVR